MQVLMKKNEKILRIFASYIPIPKGGGFTALLVNSPRRTGISSPSSARFIAAFISRSRRAPHRGHFQRRSPNDKSFFTYLHT
jgi:hypothetical protein